MGLLTLVTLLALLAHAALPHASSAQTTAAVRTAIRRALPPLARSAGGFNEQRACVSCHHHDLPILAFHLARDRGFAIDNAVLARVEDRAFRALTSATALDDAAQGANVSDPTPTDSYLLMAAHAAGLAPRLTPAVYARRLARWQHDDGRWVTNDFRPPSSSSAFTATATAVRAIQLYMPEELRAERDAAVGRARHWLAETSPLTTEDASFRLLGLVWAGGTPSEIDASRQALLAMRTPAGSWPQLPRYRADAYSTGEALYALRESGVPATDAAYRTGVAFLISTQAADGTWRVRTRMISPASVSPPYFETGFPYRKDQFISYAGSCWATLALLGALPDVGPAGAASGPRAEEPAVAAPPAWARTALFGSAEQLREALDGGLDANSATEGGTTLLMLAAPDEEKVRLLLARGAKPTARTPSGVDALTVAASYRGAAGSLAALLDAGAEAQSPAGTRVKNTPLGFASMTGDLAAVRLLLSRGADPEVNTPLASAVTFGHADVVDALLAAGASAGLTESTGINLLHWAVIADRPSVIPALARAGAKVNGTDEFGYTPLMYAATIDFGHTNAIAALLAAGANPTIRNEAGRTAIQQARRLRHAGLVAALRRAR